MILSKLGETIDFIIIKKVYLLYLPYKKNVIWEKNNWITLLYT